MSIQSAAPSTLSTHNTSTHSVFGRRVKEGAEFDQFKKEVLATYKDSDINIKEEDIKREFCFTRKKLPIPIIGDLIIGFSRLWDQHNHNKAISTLDWKAGDNIYSVHHEKRWLNYGSWKKGILNATNGEIKMKKNKNGVYTLPYKVLIHRAKKLTKALKNLTFNENSLALEHRVLPDKGNQRLFLQKIELVDKS